MDSEKMSLILKAMADTKRMKIVNLLSNGKMCACELLEHFECTQPTLSHHMKILEKAEIVFVVKKSQWHYYELKSGFVEEFMSFMTQVLSPDEKGSK